MEKFGIVLPLRNQYFIMRTAENFSEKSDRYISNVDACLLDWPITEEGKLQARDGAISFLDMRPIVWPQWKRKTSLALLNSSLGFKEVSRKLKMYGFFTWFEAVKKLKFSKSSTESDQESPNNNPRSSSKIPPPDLELFCSDFKVAKQTAQIVQSVWAEDESIRKINVHFTPLLRERSLGKGFDSGGFDGCGNREMEQIWSLDQMDGSHKLGGIESCEQTISRFMQLLRETEFLFQDKQIVLISHCNLVRIVQTIFYTIRPGMHRLVPELQQGDVRELKFQTSITYDAEVEQEQSPYLRVYLCVSSKLEHVRDTIIERVFPRMGDMCAERRVAFSYVDYRSSELDEGGLQRETLFTRLALLEACNVFLCVLDPEEEVTLSISDTRLAAMERPALFAYFASLFQSAAPAAEPADYLDAAALEEEEEERGEGGGAVERFRTLCTVLREEADKVAAAASDAERLRLVRLSPDILKRDLDRQRQQAADEAVGQMMQAVPGGPARPACPDAPGCCGCVAESARLRLRG